MIHNVFRLAVWAIVFTALACGSKTQETSDEAISEETWREMDDFHMIMAESFHPFKDSSNLKPAMSNAADMAAAAERWASAPLPDRVDNEDVKSKLDQLKTKADDFVVIVRDGDEQKIAGSLTALHDLFHELQEEWYAAAGTHDEHH